MESARQASTPAITAATSVRAPTAIRARVTVVTGRVACNPGRMTVGATSAGESAFASKDGT